MFRPYGPFLYINFSLCLFAHLLPQSFLQYKKNTKKDSNQFGCPMEFIIVFSSRDDCILAEKKKSWIAIVYPTKIGEFQVCLWAYLGSCDMFHITLYLSTVFKIKPAMCLYWSLGISFKEGILIIHP